MVICILDVAIWNYKKKVLHFSSEKSKAICLWERNVNLFDHRDWSVFLATFGWDLNYLHIFDCSVTAGFSDPECLRAETKKQMRNIPGKCKMINAALGIPPSDEHSASSIFLETHLIKVCLQCTYSPDYTWQPKVRRERTQGVAEGPEEPSKTAKESLSWEVPQASLFHLNSYGRIVLLMLVGFSHATHTNTLVPQLTFTSDNVLSA